MTTETQASTGESRLSAIEAVLPHLATKEDVAKLETKMVETKHEMLKWMAGMTTAATTILGLLITLTD